MPDYAFQAILPAASGLPEDVSTNTWHFHCDTLADTEDAEGQLRAFYDDICLYLSDENSGDLQIKIYDLADAPPRVPKSDTTLSLTSLGNTALPSQVALVMSFQAVAASGQPQARRRNRVFLGPLSATASVNEARPTSTFRNALATAGDTLLAASDAASNWWWGVWSPTSSAMLLVDNGWVDDRFDTQRRRLRRPTTRTTFSN